MDLQLTGKVVLVTAASRGLGKASAMALAQEGARLAMSSRSDMLKAAADEIRQETGAQVSAIPADVTAPADIERLVQQTIKEYGRIDILVINAGGPPAGSFLDFTARDWEAAVQLTLMSAVRLCYAVLPHMLEQGSGSIIAIESVSVKQPIDNLILSNSIRMAVIGLLKSLANEFGPKGIRVNSVNPTFTRTGRVTSLLQNRAESNGTDVERETAKALANIPLRRMGDPAEFGRTVAWLASPAASFIHGHALMFDGGAAKSPL
jgi:3-oxoacyl-[acyl-carrier protein] reductase